MLTYAFDLLYAIYEEQGYQATDIPRLILTNNLYGVEIDPRAGALAAFALTMKAREKYRRFLSSGKVVQPNICVLENIKFDPQELDDYMDKVGRDLFSDCLQGVVNQWEEADNFGSLIRPLVTDVSDVLELLRERQMGEDLFMASVHQHVLKALRQADFLSPKYHVVVANPPYMGSKGMNAILKEYVRAQFPNGKSDMGTAFIERNFSLAASKGFISMITMQSWMFLSSYQKIRLQVLTESTISTLAHLGERAFDTIGGAVVSTVAFVLECAVNAKYKGTYIRLTEGENEQEKQMAFSDPSNHYAAAASDFNAIPSAPLTYWLSDRIRQIFRECESLEEFAKPVQGATTSDNGRFLRLWHEVPFDRIGFGFSSFDAAAESGCKWFPYNKGGSFRRWSGNQEFVINYENDGEEIKEFHEELNKTKPGGRLKNQDRYFRPCLSWSKISTGSFAIRFFPQGFIFDVAGSAVFPDSKRDTDAFNALLNSSFVGSVLTALSPTLNFEAEHVSKIPVLDRLSERLADAIPRVQTLVANSDLDWNSQETAWGFQQTPYALTGKSPGKLAEAAERLFTIHRERVRDFVDSEREINALVADAYEISDEIKSDVDAKSVSLFCNPAYRYDADDEGESELEALLLADTMREFISYAVGCMLGRYSLDKPGLILANQGETADDYLLKVSNQTELLDEDRAISETDSVVFVTGAAVACFSCGDTVPTDEAAFVISEYEQGATPLRGRPLIYCSNCAEGPQASNVTRQQPLAKFSVRQALDREWCEPDTLKKFISMAGCFGHRVPADPDKISFMPDDDNVIPLLDGDWFTDDISQRFREFLKVTFGTEHYDENLTFLENALYPDNLTGKKRKTIRDYFLKEFYNHHVKLYKKRPIYWLFSSPKGTFNALIYMHRYRPDTVSVVLSYLRDFRDKLTHHTAHLQSVADRADGSKSDKTKALKQINEFKKQLKELDDYERTTLFPLAQKQIPIDLDDGVKVNYPKFGAALKKIPGLEKQEA